jgi:uncharacterized protein (DUF2141 family)
MRLVGVEADGGFWIARSDVADFIDRSRGQATPRRPLPGRRQLKGKQAMFTSITTTCLVALALTNPDPVAASDADSSVIVRMSRLRSDAGQVVVVIHDNADHFPGDAPLRQTTASIADGQAVVRFLGLPDGTYAVSMFHDENGNGELDKTWIGRPKEGVGASNNPRPLLRAPNFEEASFELVGGHTAWIKVRYL